ncbi:MAG: hypothetical protein R8G66_20045 [Cytophagales bacterium]|nr:hypothetical protein [Cytophagales bacterium]
MNKLTISVLILFSVHFADAQQFGAYAFARTPQIVNVRISQAEANYSQGLSVGLGLTHNAHFLELGTFIFEGDSYEYYSFLGSTLKSTTIGDAVQLNTNWFGEVTHFPVQGESKNASWAYTGGVCLFPNVQLHKVNVGIPVCLGLAYQEKEYFLNSRFMLNLSYRL